VIRGALPAVGTSLAPKAKGGDPKITEEPTGLKGDCESRPALPSGIVKRLKRRRRRLLHLNAALSMRRVSQHAEVDVLVRRT